MGKEHWMYMVSIYMLESLTNIIRMALEHRETTSEILCIQVCGIRMRNKGMGN